MRATQIELQNDPEREYPTAWKLPIVWTADELEYREYIRNDGEPTWNGRVPNEA
jgi:hypothetical protein